MIPIEQTIFYDPDAPPEKQRGNCLSAVVASLLELSIEEVPNFVQDHVNHEGDPEWDWWTRLHNFVREQGFRLRYLRAVETPGVVDREDSAFADPEPGEFYTVSGVSPRNPAINHIVIYQDGRLVHDPYPGAAGLARITDMYHWSLERVT